MPTACGALEINVSTAVAHVGEPSSMGPLVTPEWVARRLDDPEVVVLQVDEEAADHHVAHPPGSGFVDWHDGVRGLLTPGPTGREHFEELMSSRGIRPQDDVVLFGDADNRYAAAVLWLLRLHGHRRLRLMDGGRVAWLSKGLPLTDQETRRPRTTYRGGPPVPGVRVSRDELLAELSGQAPASVLLDCRSVREHLGHSARAARGAVSADVGGHVPGAQNLPVSLLVDPDGSLFDSRRLEALLGAAGLSREQTLTAYCHRSERSCLAWFVLHEVLGYPNVRVYDGGWQEYSHLVGVPICRTEPDDSLAD